MLNIAVIDDWQGLAPGYADWSALAGKAQVRFYRDPLGSDAATVAALADCDIIVPLRERTQFTAALMAQLPRLRMMALTGRGTKHVDLPTCARRGIVLSGSGSYTPESTAELALGLMLAAARRIAAGDAAIRRGDFQEQLQPGYTLAGRTLGILGMGRIGARVAQYGQALGMDVIGWGRSYDTTRAAQTGVAAVGKDELFRRADVLSIHLGYYPETHGFVSAADLAAMKPGALLVNTARGALVDEAALFAALHAGRLTAALDVFEQEPLPTDHPLRRAPNTVLTPHLGFNTQATFEAFYRQSVENILGFLRREPQRLMNPECLPNVRWVD